MRKRNYDMHLMLNKNEYKKLEALSKQGGLNHSTILRKLIREEPIRLHPASDFRDLSRAVDRIGNNYNQIAHKVNMGDATADDISESARLLTEIRREIAAWKERWY